MNTATAKPDELRALGAELKLDQPPAPSAPAPAAPKEQGAASPPTPGAADVEAELDQLTDMTPDDARDLSGWAWNFLFNEATEALPFLDYPQELREKAIAKTAPVVYKWRDKFPHWFKLWRQEIELGMFVAGVAYGTYKQIKVEKERREKIIADRKAAAPAPGEHKVQVVPAGPDAKPPGG